MNIENLENLPSSLLSSSSAPSSSATSLQESTFSDDDSGFGASSFINSEYATTVNSELSAHVYELGRRYHSYRAGTYLLPNDSKEVDRLELYHCIFQFLLDGSTHFAPLSNPKNILDVGCGAGEWAMDIAEKYPEARVLGIDLSKIQPPWAPPNCRFEVDDAESDFINEKPFDYVHLRAMSGAFADWSALLRRYLDHMTPGGYIEFQDYGAELFVSDEPSHFDQDNPRPAEVNTPFERWFDTVRNAGKNIGKPFNVASTMKARMEAVGFKNVRQRREIWPLGIGSWTHDSRLDELSHICTQGMIQSFIAYSNLPLTRVLGWSHSEVLSLCKAAQQDLMKTKKMYWIQAWFIYGQKLET